MLAALLYRRLRCTGSHCAVETLSDHGSVLMFRFQISIVQCIDVQISQCNAALSSCAVELYLTAFYFHGIIISFISCSDFFPWHFIFKEFPARNLLTICASRIEIFRGSSPTPPFDICATYARHMRGAVTGEIECARVGRFTGTPNSFTVRVLRLMVMVAHTMQVHRGGLNGQPQGAVQHEVLERELQVVRQSIEPPSCV